MKQEQTQAVEAAKIDEAIRQVIRCPQNSGHGPCVHPLSDHFSDAEIGTMRFYFKAGLDAGRDHSPDDEKVADAIKVLNHLVRRKRFQSFDEGVHIELDALKTLLAAVRPSSWVSVEERLPDEKYRHEWLHFTLSHSDERWVERRFYDDNLKRRLEERDSLFVAWMPLPEPYQISGPQIEQEKP